MAETKLLKDLIALAKTSSFTQAAELRNITHPAFSRRIKQLEYWAGAELINRSTIPVQLTPKGKELLITAEYVISRLNIISKKIKSSHTDNNYPLRIATGRYLACTLVADWMHQMTQAINSELNTHIGIEIRTGSTPDMVALLQRNEVDFLCCYEHPSLSIPIVDNNFQYLQLGTDKFVPVALRPNQNGIIYNLDDEFTSIPHISYHSTLSLYHILSDHLRANAYALEPVACCDSVEVARTLVLKGLGLAWLPWSVVASDCKVGDLVVIGGKQNQVPFEVRMYRPKEPLSIAAEIAWKRTTEERKFI